MPALRIIFAATLGFLGIWSVSAAKPLRAGAAIVDISPTNYPVIVNAMFTERTATRTVDPLTVRAVVLDNEETHLALVLVDTCMMPRDLIDKAKSDASKECGIPTERMLISATHTHSAPAAMGCLGSRVDPAYAAYLPGRISEAIVMANSKLQPARIGWAVVNDWEHTFNRRWIRRPDQLLEDPFGERTVRANMHPGHESAEVTGPSGPVDPGLSVLAIETVEGRPLALLANYSMHYYESELLSSDYFGKFSTHIANLLGAGSNFVGIMSQGTSGDLMWMDYGAPRKQIGYDAYAREIAARVYSAYSTIKFTNRIVLKMAESRLALNYRVPDQKRLAWARDWAGKVKDRLPQQMPEIYALEALHLHERQKTELVLQALRIGDFGITALPNEVYALTGLKLKAQSPLQPCMNIELANGAEGYIPPPEQHELGGYTTWPARTAGLEVEAEPKIVEVLLTLLETVSGKPRLKSETAPGAYTKTVLASDPAAYWRMEEMKIPLAQDATRHGRHASIENGVALYLPGPGSGSGISPDPVLRSSQFSSPGEINRALHFAGGRVHVDLPELTSTYSVELWFWNGLPNDARLVTAYMFSRGASNDPDANGEHIGIGGKHGAGSAGRLILFNGNKKNQILQGNKEVAAKAWHHLVFVRDRAKATVYLDGVVEFSGEIPAPDVPSPKIFIGGRNDNFANFEGKIDEVAIYNRALPPDEILQHYKSADTGLTKP